MKKLFASIVLIAYAAFAGAVLMQYKGQFISSPSTHISDGIEPGATNVSLLTEPAGFLHAHGFHYASANSKIKFGSNPVPVEQDQYADSYQSGWLHIITPGSPVQASISAVPLFLRHLRLRL